MAEFNKYEFIYDYHFQKEFQKRNCKGLEIIEDLHNLSKEPEFAEARKLFNVQFIPNIKTDIDKIEKILLVDDSLLICSFSVDQRGAHITTLGCDEKRKWFNRNTDLHAEGIQFFDSIITYVQANDGLLANRK